MDKQLKWVLLLPLKEMALRKVAVLLWSGSDVLASISKFRFIYSGIANGYRKEWRETLEPKIKDKVSKLGLPASLAKEMIDLVKPISLEIIRWKEQYEVNHFVEIGLPGSTKLCWTNVGRIDDRRTAEELVRCEEMNVMQRYEIACFYCLEDWIPLLWEELPEERKHYYLNAEALSLSLQFRWPRILKGDHSYLDDLLMSEDMNLTSFNQWAFELSAKKGYRTAVEHFLKKLTHKEREASLMTSSHDLLEHIDLQIVDDERTCDFMCYLLTLMTPERQMEFIKAYPISILMIFFQWPLQDLFLENARLLWTFIPPSGYHELLSRMAEIFQQSEHCFPKLFQEFFIQSPLAFKKDSVYRGYAHDFLTIFIDFEYSESIQVIFRNLEAADRVEVLCHPDILVLFYKEILMGRWHMVEVCLREAMLSEVDGKRLEKAISRHCCFNRKNPVFKRLFQFLHTYPSSDKETKPRKRKLCPETLSSAGR